MSRSNRPSKTKGKGRPVAKAKAKGNRKPAARRDKLKLAAKARSNVEAYNAAVESAQIAQAMGEGRGILDVDPTEFGLPEDYDDGERYFAHAMAKDD